MIPWGVCAVPFFCRPTARPTLRCSLRPPVGRSARAVRTLNIQNERRISGCCGVAPQTRGEPGRRRRQSVAGRGEAVGRPPRSVAQPDRGDQRPHARSARRQPVATTVTRPGRRRPHAADGVFLRKRCRPGCRSAAERRSALPRGAAPRGRREEPTVMLVDADGHTRQPGATYSIPCARRMPKAAAEQRYLRVPPAPRSASKPVPLDAGFRISASPLWQTLSSKSGLFGSGRSSFPARRVQRAVPQLRRPAAPGPR